MTCVLACAACSPRETPSSPPSPSQPSEVDTAPAGPRRTRRESVAVTVLIDRKPAADDAQAVVLSTAALPGTPALIKRGGVTLGVIGLPKTMQGAEAVAYLERTIRETSARSDAIVLVSEHCLEALQPIVTQHLVAWWMLALVAAPGCGAPVASPIGVTALVDSHHAAPVRLVFDRATRAILTVE